MKKIGEGYFYRVYDLGNGKVIKKQKSKFKMFLYILFVNGFLPRAFKEYKSALRNIISTQDIYQGIRDRFSDLKLFGNPKFLDGINYEQDKVLTIKQFLKTSTEEQIKEVLEKYILLIKELWKHGCHEKVFNFTINNGIDNNGNVLLIDFNEVSFSKEDVIKDIKNKTWEHRWSYTHLQLISKSDVREFYSKRMEKELTFENLNRLWDTNLTS